MDNFVERVKRMIEAEAEASMDRGTSEAEWLETLEEILDFVQEEVAAARESVG